MRALQVLRAIPRPWSGSTARCVIGVIGGVLWWGAVLGLVIRPDGAGPWPGAMVVGGWSLGLIPLHAVPRRTGGRNTGRRGRGATPGGDGDGGYGGGSGSGSGYGGGPAGTALPAAADGVSLGTGLRRRGRGLG